MTPTIPANEPRYVGEIAVQRTRILGTPVVVYTAYEPNSGWNHGTITFIGDQCYGKLRTRNDDRAWRHLAGGSPERIAAVESTLAAYDMESYVAILTAFPEAANGGCYDGDIEVVIEPV